MKKLSKQSLDGNIETMILAVLHDGPNYAYAILNDLDMRTEGLLEFSKGTIYPVLRRMETKKYVSSKWSKQKGTRKRKYYRLTAKGKKSFKNKCLEWSMLNEIMDLVVGDVDF